MSVFNLLNAFRTGTGAVVAHNQVPVPPAGINPAVAQAGATAVSPGTAPNGVVPAGAAEPPKNPLDAFAELWAPPKVDPANPNAGNTPLFANADPAKLLEMARKQDFRPQVTQEQMAAIAKGGAEAVGVMMELMNDVGQKAYATSAHATTQLIMGALDKSQFAKVGDLESHIKKSKVSESLKADNPLFSNPAVAPMLAGLEQQLLLKHPDATSAEIANMAKQYFQGVVDIVQAPEKKKQEVAIKKGETNWESFLNG